MKKCKYCHQVLSDEYLAERKRLKGLAISKGLLNSTNAGRKRGTNYEHIKDLRRQGMTIRNISKQVGCSNMTVQRAIKELK